MHNVLSCLPMGNPASLSAVTGLILSHMAGHGWWPTGSVMAPRAGSLVVLRVNGPW